VLEIALAVRDTNPRKAPGPDGVYHSLIKRYLDVIMPILLREYNKIWESGDTPGEWFTTGKTILFFKHKGGDKSDPKNFHPITMGNTIHKILSAIIDKRMLTSMMKTGNWDREQQAMGKTRRMCPDTHMISEVVVKMCRQITGQTLNIAYVDFRKAYDSVSHEALTKILEKTVARKVKSIKQRLSNTVKMLMAGWKTFIVNVEEPPRKVLIKRGIFQGEKMSPTLFCVALTILKAQKSDTVELHSIESSKEGKKLT